jgi:hypothetical protein
MNQLIESIRALPDPSFPIVKSLLESRGISTAEYTDLYLIGSTGTILQKNTNIIVSVIGAGITAPKTQPISEIPISLYYWNSKWNIGTHTCVNADFQLVQVGEFNLTVGHLFADAWKSQFGKPLTEFTQLDLAYCYQMVFTIHPEKASMIRFVSRYHLKRGMYESLLSSKL